MIYNNIETSITNNGYLTNWFKLQKGVRQGCPLSPYLFILASEILSIQIRANRNINGIDVNSREYKISQLADDTVCFLSDTKSVEETLKIFELFKQCSGLKINLNKTKAIPLGSLRNKELNIPELDCTEKYVETLGVIITDNEEDHYKNNFKHRILNLKQTLNIWRTRNLTLKGKTIIINSLALPSLLYLSSNIHVPLEAIKEIKTHVRNFIWDGKPPKINMEVIEQNIENGGLNLIDYEQKTKALKAMWVKRLCKDKEKKWTAFPKWEYKTNELDLFFSQCPKPMRLHLNFYEEVLNGWQELKENVNMSIEQIIHEIIWNNKRIKINNKYVQINKWIQHGVIYVNDIINKDGEFLDEKEIYKKYNLKTNFMELEHIKRCLPSIWKEQLKSYNGEKQNELKKGTILFINNKIYTIDKITCKKLYTTLINRRNKKPASICKWEENFPRMKNEEKLWQDIWTRCWKSTNNTKLQSFQYKLLHRLINCQKRLKDWKIVTDTSCKYCKKYDDIIHFMISCPTCLIFWKNLFKWWNSIETVEINVLREDIVEIILFGFRLIDDTFAALNYMMILAKYFIYINKQETNNINNIAVISFLPMLKENLDIEKSVYQSKNNIKNFMKYNKIYIALGGESVYHTDE
jgi:hypothetical protein